MSHMCQACRGRRGDVVKGGERNGRICRGFGLPAEAWPLATAIPLFSLTDDSYTTSQNCISIQMK